MNKDIEHKLTSLREFMINNNVDAFVIPSTDPHSGEYIPEHWESRKWISGFTGSAGTVVITKDKAGLWTDSRYFIQAEEQLEDTGIELFKEKLPHTPTIDQWLKSVLDNGAAVGIDGWTNSMSSISDLSSSLSEKSITVISTPDPFATIWKDRRSLPSNKVFVHELRYCGKTHIEKIQTIREELSKNNKSALLLSSLDEIAWTLNLRGDDVHCNPVFISYLLILPKKCILYINKEKLNDEITASLENSHIEIRPYEAIEDDLQTIKSEQKDEIQLSPSVNYAIFNILKDLAFIAPSPVAMLKAVKNKTEIEGFHKAMLRDGVAMVKFLRWIKDAVKSGKETEISVSDKLYSLRAEQDLFKGISFDTIAGYKEHGAIVHYEATPETDVKLNPEGMLLLDSGGQYLDGTTDITRTVILGPVSDEEKQDYTLVLKGMINLAMAVFPEGTCGTQLDILARSAMWKNGINYMHGTGHGVGCFLNVHEGPHQIRMNNMPTPLQPGMTITDEPGIYKAGRHGIRTENTMIVTEAQESEFGRFFKLEPLTLCPIDKDAIVKDMLNKDEQEWLNNYHKNVLEKLSPLLDGDDLAWLQKATTAL